MCTWYKIFLPGLNIFYNPPAKEPSIVFREKGVLLLIFNKLLLIPFLFWVSHLAEVSVSLVASQRAHFKNSVARTLKSEARKQ